MRLEYRSLVLPFSAQEFKRGLPAITDELNKLGAEGWEAYSTVFDGKGINEILFKRHK